MWNSKKQNNHSHSHGNMPIIFYIFALMLSIIALFMNNDYIIIKNTLFIIASIMAGYHVIILEGVGETYKQTLKYKKFLPNSHILMGLAAIGSAILGEFWEGLLLILIFSGAHFLEDYAEGKSKREISKLLKMNPTTARLVDYNGNIKIVEVSTLKIGDKLKVLNGDQVPIDGKILSGITSIDESSINGESIPKEKSVSDEVYGSTINGTGTFIMEVTKENQDTVFSKIIKLVSENQKNKTKIGTIIQKFEPKYVTMVLIFVFLYIITTPIVLQWSWNESFYRGLVILVSAAPCALAAATVSVTLSATSNLAKQGVLSKGTSYLSELGKIDAISFDKTGTLTKGTPEVTDFYFNDSINKNYITDVIIAMEKNSNHPLASAILKNFQSENSLIIEVENKIGQGLLGTYNDKEYRIGKPTSFKEVPANIQSLCNSWSSEGKTSIYISENDFVIGIIGLMDTPHEESKQTIQYFKKNKIHTTLITGDSELTGKAIGTSLGIDEVIANVMPEDKSNIIKSQKREYGIVSMVGDGVNDAPALVSSDIGVAMGNGTDVAVEVSDLALMQNKISKLMYAHKIAKKMNKIIWQNIIFSIIIAIILVLASIIGITNISISVMIHEGSTLIVIINGLRLLKNNSLQ